MTPEERAQFLIDVYGIGHSDSWDEDKQTDDKERIAHEIRAAERAVWLEAAEVDPLSVDCPECDESVDQPCTEWGHAPVDPHNDRWRAAIRAKAEEEA